MGVFLKKEPKCQAPIKLVQPFPARGGKNNRHEAFSDKWLKHWMVPCLKRYISQWFHGSVFTGY